MKPRILPALTLAFVALLSFAVVACGSVVRESAARRAHVDAVLMGVE